MTRIIRIATIFALVTLGMFCLAGCTNNTQTSTQQNKVETFADEATDFESTNEASSDGEAQEVQEAQEASANETSPVAQQLEEQFASIANSTSMNVSISLLDFADPQNSCSFDGATGRRSASTIKLMVLYELLQQVHDGTLSLDEPYTLTSSDIVGGTGVLQGRGAGATTTFREMAELMINQSDNTATNVIIDRVGMNNINARAKQLGLNSVQLNRRMMDTAALAAGIDNYLSTDDANRLLKMVNDGTFVDPQMSAFALSALRSQTDHQGLLAGLPYGTEFAHKTGTLSNAQNDCGIVLGNHIYALAVFCEAGPTGYFSASEAFGIMSRVAQCVSSTLA